MTTFDPQNARVLWRLRRTRSDVTCVLYGGGMPVEVRVLHDEEVVLTELFQEEAFALGWAKGYEARLREQGWLDSPVRKAS